MYLFDDGDSTLWNNFYDNFFRSNYPIFNTKTRRLLFLPTVLGLQHFPSFPLKSRDLCRIPLTRRAPQALVYYWHTLVIISLYDSCHDRPWHLFFLSLRGHVWIKITDGCLHVRCSMLTMNRARRRCGMVPNTYNGSSGVVIPNTGIRIINA